MTNKLFEHIKLLPEDIKRKIYNNHFHVQQECNKLLKWWNDNYQLNVVPMKSKTLQMKYYHINMELNI